MYVYVYIYIYNIDIYVCIYNHSCKQFSGPTGTSILMAMFFFWQVLLALAKSQCKSLTKDFLELSGHFDLSLVRRAW